MLSFFNNQIPSHTHTRGSMNITGEFSMRSSKVGDGYYSVPRTAKGTFYVDVGYYSELGHIDVYANSSERRALNKVGFDASRSWTGEKIK